jgi:hypothetical protein
MEKEPEIAKPGGTYRVADLDLASRLSFFLWGTPPDQELQTLAAQGKLTAPGALEKQARRLLADARADALGTRHLAAQIRIWLAPLLPPAEARATLAEARALAESGNRARLLEEIAQLELKIAN